MAEAARPRREKAARWTIRAAPFLFLAVAALVGFRKPGLQYDEALFEHGTVQMLTSGAEPPFAHDPGSWIEVGGRWWPLMVIPYAGAAQQYALLPLFALLGPSPAAARVFGALLAAAGIFLLGRSFASWVAAPAAAAAVLIGAVHPDLMLTVLYDDGGFAQWTACLGLLAAALARHVRRRRAGSAVLLGAAAGFAVWCRSNFVWLLVPLAAALLIVYGRKAIPRASEAAAIAVGGVLGGSPLLVYELGSRFATLRFLGAGHVSPWRKFPDRFRFFAESLVLDRNRAVIWGGQLPSRPILAVAAAVVVGSCLLLLFPLGGADRETRVGRAASLSALGYLAFAFWSGLNVVPHHFVAIVPVEALAVALAGRRLIRNPAGRGAVTGLALGYGAAAVLVLGSAASGIRATGGSRSWSDAIAKVADVLQNQYPRRDVHLLDWGFENNLFVLSNGALSMDEEFWPADGNAPGGDLPIDPSGVYVAHGPANRYFPAAKDRFLRRLAGHPGFEKTVVRQQDGETYAEIYAARGGAPAPVRIAAIHPERIVAGKSFNVQPSGRSALAIAGSGFRRSDRVWWNGHPLRTAFGGPALVSAEVPADLFDEPGSARITIRHGNRVEPGGEAEITVAAAGR